MSERLRVVLVDDHELVRQGVNALLQREPDIEVVGEAADGLAALELVERVRPDVLVADLILPGLGGLELTRQAARRSPGTRVVVLSMHAAEPLVLEALDRGASAYVLKDAGIQELVRAIREVARGRRYLSPPNHRTRCQSCHRCRWNHRSPVSRDGPSCPRLNFRSCSP